MQNATKPESNQDAFNRVWQHFIVEKNARCATGGGCQYFTNESGKVNGCAVGCMVPEYMSAGLIGTIGGILASDSYEVVRAWFSEVDSRLLQDLQYAHDSNFQHLEYSLREIAKNWQLTARP